MADQRKITLRPGHASPRDIVLRELPVATPASTGRIYLYPGHAAPGTIVVGDPTVLRPSGGGAITGTAAGTQAAATGAAAGAETFTGAAAGTQAAATGAATGEENFLATVDGTQAAALGEAAGSVVGEAFTGEAAGTFTTAEGYIIAQVATVDGLTAWGGSSGGYLTGRERRTPSAISGTMAALLARGTGSASGGLGYSGTAIAPGRAATGLARGNINDDALVLALLEE